jgi:ABC-type uncharacterized transport system involved in gliding motility auxiliary subunit
VSKIGKITLFFAFLSFAALMATRLVLGGWHNGMWAPLAMFILFLGWSLTADRAFWVEFLSMRTTKHGLNMGVLILIALVGLIAVNVLAVRYEKKFDWTSEGLNSLSEQSVKTVKGLQKDVELVLLYRKEQQQENLERATRDLADLYTNASSKIKFTAYNALTRPDLAKQYGFTYGPYALFLVSGPQHVRVDKPTEEEITKALLKIGREKKKVIYFTTGHGERPLDEQKPEGLSEFKADLETVYDVKPLALFQEGKVPADAAIVAIIGPQQQLLEPELKALRDYARAGGRLLIAGDPGEKSNLALLTKSLGVEFENDYVLDPRANIPGAGNVAALGTVFSQSNEITQPFQGGMSIFLLASSLKKDPGAPASLKIDEIVKTDDKAVAASSIDQGAKLKGQGPLALAIAVEGKLPGEPEGKEFNAVVFGDSDFMTNSLFRNNLNRDLVMNSIASLSKDKDLISIRPKAPKGTTLDLTREKFVMLMLGFLLPLPLLFLAGGGWIWWRRRTA